MGAKFYRRLFTGSLGVLLGLGGASPLLLSAEADRLSYQGLFTWINAVSYQLVADDHPLNQGNLPLKLPAYSLVSELRPDLRFTHPSLELVARPRIRHWYATTSAIQGRPTPAPQGAVRGRLNEAFLQWTLSPQLMFAYGLQSYQWGPAEALSPSNRLFHESVLDRHALHEVHGKYLARLNFSLGEQLSLILMSEYQANRDEPIFQAEQPFSSLSLLKGEYSWNGGANYIGLVVGGREHGQAWLGEYFNIELYRDAGFFLYADASHQRGSAAYYPSPAASLNRELQPASLPEAPPPLLATLEASRRADGKIYTLAAIGLRYDHTNGTIVRGEYLLNDAGYSKAERATAFASLTTAAALPAAAMASQGARAMAPGLELPGQRYLYASLFKPDAFATPDLNASLRLLYSLTDWSFNSYFTLDYAIGDAGSVYIASSLNHGETTSELGGLTSQSHMMGYRHVW